MFCVCELEGDCTRRNSSAGGDAFHRVSPSVRPFVRPSVLWEATTTSLNLTVCNPLRVQNRCV